MKRFSIVVLMFVLLLSGCSKTPEQPELSFKDYLDQVLIDSMDPSDIGINFTFVNPEKFGITPEPYDLGFLNEDDFNEIFKNQETLVNTLKSYRDEDLSEQEIMDRDALIASFEMAMGAHDYYEYEVGSNVLGFSRAFSGNVPAYLETYDFHNEADVVGYLNFLETLQASYQQYLDLELRRQESGTGYGQEELNEIIKQAQDSAEAMGSSDYFLIDDFATKIKELKLPKEQEYLDQQKRLVNENLASAYQLIADVLSKVEAQPTTGLANKPNGKKYYEYLLQSSTGSTKSVDDIKDLIAARKYEAIVSLRQMAGKMDVNAYFKRLEDETYGEFSDGYDLLNFLEGKMVTDFPAIGDVNYELKQVDESMADASSPAFYFTPYADYTPEFKQTIYINGDFQNSLYKTYAHEGYPGHMYQFNYFLGLDMHPLRLIYTDSSNAEGWANYIESIAHSYVEEDQDFVEFSAINDAYMQILHIEIDIGIHYDGWTKEEFAKYVGEEFGIDKQEQVDEVFMNFTHNPAVYPTYYLSTIYIQEMKDKVKMALGSDYSEREFHTEFLKSGSVGFDFIEKQIDAYLAKKGS